MFCFNTVEHKIMNLIEHVTFTRLLIVKIDILFCLGLTIGEGKSYCFTVSCVPESMFKVIP